MEIGEASALITTLQLYRRKVEPWRHELPSLKQVFLTGCDEDYLPEGTISLKAAMASSSGDFEIAHTRPDDLALLHFTSGTTARPKGAMHVHEAVLSHGIGSHLALDLPPR
jgi:acetyl-CoA synthetase